MPSQAQVAFAVQSPVVHQFLLPKKVVARGLLACVQDGELCACFDGLAGSEVQLAAVVEDPGVRKTAVVEQFDERIERDSAYSDHWDRSVEVSRAALQQGNLNRGAAFSDLPVVLVSRRCTAHICVGSTYQVKQLKDTHNSQR